jgi:class 3 adenylate cyclase/tetratricopeptide (TPR) repeat protein
MKCPKCQTFNRVDARFCEECAAPLAKTCANCGHQLSPSAKFCPECAHPTATSASLQTIGRDQSPFGSPDTYTPNHLARRILASKAALEGERKQVTVLFADLKGSMELLVDRDPEEARQLLDPVLEHMMEAVHHYEGTVSQAMGDGIVALFGAPLAHEDHAVRACYAALRMQERVKHHAKGVFHAHGVTVQIRVGLNSGEVVVRAISSDLHMDYSAIGRTTHLAARMEQLARPGGILLTPSTLELANGFVTVTSLGTVPIKGLAEPLEVHEVTGVGPVRTRLQAVARRGLTRFVGREPELEQLRRAQQLAGAGHGQVAALVAEAGVGKSRLVYELAHSQGLEGWLVMECAAVSYGKAMSYLPVVNLLKNYFEISEQDSLQAISDKVDAKLLALDRELAPTLPAMLALLDAPVDDPAWQTLDPAQRRRLMLDAVRHLLQRESRKRPLLLIFEDLHWIDSETQALLDSLVESLGSARILLLATYRPEYQHGWVGKTYYSQIRLDALAAESAGKLLDALLGNDTSLAPLKQLFVRRGNPFFLEETVRTLVETKELEGSPGRYRLTRPVKVIQVPATVQAMLAARVDRLSLEDKRLLQVAAVVGKRVPFSLLRSVADLPDEALSSALDRLQAAEFVNETGLFPDLEYSFKHALTQDVAYSGMLQDRRRELHARIVQAFESLYQDRLGEQIERLAYHALRGELREKAVDYLRQSGLKATARGAIYEARAWFEQGLNVLEALEKDEPTVEQAFEIHMALANVLLLLDDGRSALEQLRAAEALAARQNNDHWRARTACALTYALTLLGAVDEALEAGKRALAIGDRLGDLELGVRARMYLAQSYHYRNEYQESVLLATDNVALADSIDRMAATTAGFVLTRTFTRGWLVRSLAELGRFAEARELASDAIRFTEQTHHADGVVARVHLAVGRLYLLSGDWAQARLVIERGLTVARTSALVHLPGLITHSAWALAELGDVGVALVQLEEGEKVLERSNAGGITGLKGLYYQVLGRTALQLGLRDEAQRLGERSMQWSPSQPGIRAHALHLLGDIAIRRDPFDGDEAKAHYRQALALAEPRGMRPLVAHCHFGLGKLHHRIGKREQACEHLAIATTMYREMDMPFWLAQAEAEKSS